MKGQEGGREGETNRERERGMMEEKQCVCLRVCAALRAASALHCVMLASRLAGWLALCSSHPISSLTDCPDPAQSADSGLQHDSYYLTSLSFLTCDDEFYHRLK